MSLLVLFILVAAFAVGFDTPSYFSRLFEERFGRKPSDFL
ncbi:MAG: AraC family transcriptional regulator [Saprospiraceae bacterium]|nr:AraC family transcriptional regulator [Saprospiraceae bacterium]